MLLIQPTMHGGGVAHPFQAKSSFGQNKFSLKPDCKQSLSHQMLAASKVPFPSFFILRQLFCFKFSVAGSIHRREMRTLFSFVFVGLRQPDGTVAVFR